MWIVPSSSISIWQPVASTMALMTLPCGPMTAPIFSGLILMLVMRGAYFDISGRGALIACAIASRIFNRASRACSKAYFVNAWLKPVSFKSV